MRLVWAARGLAHEQVSLVPLELKGSDVAAVLALLRVHGCDVHATDKVSAGGGAPRRTMTA